jgi:predicted enzyme related to lactoylglutathione lyase
MIRSIVIAGLLLTPGTVAIAQTNSAPAPIVFFDIAGPDGSRLQRFYADVFGWRVASDGAFTATVTAPLPGTIRQDPAETVIYFGVPDVTAALTKVQANGGTIQAPRFEVPGRVILGLFKDPAGNRVGLVEMENGKAKVPTAKP